MDSQGTIDSPLDMSQGQRDAVKNWMFAIGSAIDKATKEMQHEHPEIVPVFEFRAIAYDGVKKVYARTASEDWKERGF